MKIKKFRKRDLISRVFKLLIKISLNVALTIKIIQLINISIKRFEQQTEIITLLHSKLSKLDEIRKRVDYLFGTDGDLYVLHENRQWIEQNRFRIVWTATAPFPSVE